MSLVSKYLISLVSLLYLWQAVSANLHAIGYTHQRWSTITRLPGIRHLDNFTSLIASQLTLHYAWRMFTPPDPYYYTLQLIVYYNGGRPSRPLRLPWQQERNWWEHNFVDAREEKFLVNLFFQDIEAREWYSRYWCRQLADSHPQAVEAILTFYSLLPPAPPKNIPWGVVSCV